MSSSFFRYGRAFLKAVRNISFSGAAGIFIAVFIALSFHAPARMFVLRSVLMLASAAPAADANGYTNILLLGVGDEDHDGADLTDTMILASIDPSDTRSAVMLSIPRDLLLEAGRIDGGGRVNALYANEKYKLMKTMAEEEASAQALQSVMDEMSARLGVPVHGVIKADFTAFTMAVDALGGVDVEVPEHIIDYTYPISEGRPGTFEIDAGMQHLDGDTALKYARSRHSTNDFSRSARQQQLLKALGEKVRGMGRIKQMSALSELYTSLDNHVETTMTTRQLLGLAQIAANVPFDRIVNMQINFGSGNDGIEAGPGGFVYAPSLETYSGASVLLPLALPGKDSDWSQISAFTRFLFSYRELYLDPSTVVLQNAGAQPVHVHRLRNELLRYGWNVTGANTSIITPSGKVDGSFIYFDDDHRDAAEALVRLLSFPSSDVDDEKSGSGDIVLILGRNFRFTPFALSSDAVSQQ
jgi:LCP family protein required for cell wall assembly